MDRAAIVEQNFRTKVTEGTLPDGRPRSGKMDLNLLKPHFTAFAIKTALDKHLKAVGPGKLEGVSYKKALRADQL